MPRTVPTPLAAALGIVPAVLDGVRALPGKVVQAPLLAVSSALSTLDSTRKGYEDLAERGDRLVARLRGTSLDEVEDAVEDALRGTPVARAYDRVEDAAEDAVAGTGRALRSVTGGAGRAVENAAEAVEKTAAAVRDDAEAAAALVPQTDDVPSTEAGSDTEAGPDTALDEAPKGAPTPKAVEPQVVRVDSAASAQAQEAADDATPVEVLAHDDLPLPDYDHMTLGSLRGRMRSLTVEQLGQVRGYEKAHADRLPVVTMLDNRIARMVSDASATSTGDAGAPTATAQPR